MTEEERRAYATELIQVHASDVEYLSVFEMAEEYAGVTEISDEDARAVHDLIRAATVRVSWENVEAPA